MSLPSSIAWICLVLGLGFLGAARFVRRRLPPSCRRCHFPIDASRPDLRVCPECGSDLRASGAIVTRGKRRRWPLLVALPLLVAACTIGTRNVLALEAAGALDAHKPTWMLAMQFPTIAGPRFGGMQAELTKRARAGVSSFTARAILERWRRGRADGALSRYDPIAEELFPTGLVPSEQIEAYSRSLLAFNLDTPDSARPGAVIPVESKIYLLGTTALGFEIERARFGVGGAVLQWEPEPHIMMKDPQSAGAASTSAMSHATTNYVPLRSDALGPQSMDATYSVQVTLRGVHIASWTTTVSHPVMVKAEIP